MELIETHSLQWATFKTFLSDNLESKERERSVAYTGDNSIESERP